MSSGRGIPGEFWMGVTRFQMSCDSYEGDSYQVSCGRVVWVVGYHVSSGAGFG